MGIYTYTYLYYLILIIILHGCVIRRVDACIMYHKQRQWKWMTLTCLCDGVFKPSIVVLFAKSIIINTIHGCVSVGPTISLDDWATVIFLLWCKSAGFLSSLHFPLFLLFLWFYVCMFFIHFCFVFYSESFLVG